jgi:hypothetical protein
LGQGLQQMAPPKLSKATVVMAWLPLRSLPVTLRVAPKLLKMAPPPAPPVLGSKFTAVVAWLLARALPVMLRLAPASLKIAPPPRPFVA